MSVQLNTEKPILVTTGIRMNMSTMTEHTILSIRFVEGLIAFKISQNITIKLIAIRGIKQAIINSKNIGAIFL
jgi:hypothetical protein